MKLNKRNILAAILLISVILLLASHWIKNPIVTFTAVSILFAYSIYDYRERRKANTNVKWGLSYLIIWGILWFAKTHDLTQYIWHHLLNK